jgi:deazaflavin-dependent oxidoreductase (nitroreductase family)
MPSNAERAAWNEALIADFRAHGGEITTGPMAGRRLMVLTTTGSRTGRPRSTPIAYTRDGDRYVVVGSNRGLHTDPAWVGNVRAHPEVTVEVGTETFRARAVVASGDERRRLYDAHATAMPNFAEYERMTEREIPVVTLERIDPV